MTQTKLRGERFLVSKREIWFYPGDKLSDKIMPAKSLAGIIFVWRSWNSSPKCHHPLLFKDPSGGAGLHGVMPWRPNAAITFKKTETHFVKAFHPLIIAETDETSHIT